MAVIEIPSPFMEYVDKLQKIIPNTWSQVIKSPINNQVEKPSSEHIKGFFVAQITIQIFKTILYTFFLFKKIAEMQLNNTIADKISKIMYIVLLKFLFYHNICIGWLFIYMI